MTVPADRSADASKGYVDFEMRRLAAELVEDPNGLLNEVGSGAVPGVNGGRELDSSYRRSSRRPVEASPIEQETPAFAVGVTAVRASGEISHTAYVHKGGRVVPADHSE